MNQKRLIFVTGAGRGIGREIALRLAREGYHVMGCSRSNADLLETKKLSNDAIDIRALDVTEQKEVVQWIQSGFSQKNLEPWGLVTSAGTLGDIAPFVGSEFQIWKNAFDVNVYGTFFVVQSFLKEKVAREEKPSGRIALLSGGGATKPMANLSSYAASKAAVVRLGETIALEMVENGYNITVNCIAPGAVNTALTKTIIEAGPEKAGKAFYEANLKQWKSGGTSPEKAAALASYLMSDQSGCINGKLISAVWDNWENLHKDPKFLKNNDLFTLRRIVETSA